MFWNRTYGHVRIIYFSEKLTSMLMVNVLCKTKKVRIFQLEMVLSSRSKDCEKFAYSVLTTRWLEDIMASMREICKLYRHTRL
jgi:phosphopantetheine adenylyltransferase